MRSFSFTSIRNSLMHDIHYINRFETITVINPSPSKDRVKSISVLSAHSAVKGLKYLKSYTAEIKISLLYQL